MSRGILLSAVVVALAATAANAKDGKPMTPKVHEAGSGTFQCAAAPAVVVGKSLATDADVCAPLVAALRTRFGADVRPNAAERALPKGPFILIGLTSDRAELRSLVAGVKDRLPPTGLGDEGYAIEVTPARILVAARKPAGAFYGVRALLDTVSAAGFEVPAGRTADWPTMNWRGIHVMASSTEAIPALDKLLTDVLPRLRMNRMIVEVDYGFQYRSHPEVAAKNGLTRDDCRRLVEVARRNHIEIIPHFECLGHQSWAKQTGELLTAHPEFDETPDLPKDNPGIYCRSWCPMHPGINSFVCDLCDELIDAFDAKALNVGMDEVFILGKCDRCKGKPTSELFAKAVNDLHSHLVGKRHVTMMMWGDRFLDAKSTGYGEWEASNNGTAPAIDAVPKDIVLCDWHYGETGTFPSVRYLQEKGFRVWPSGWNSEANARNLATRALEAMGPKMVGYLATTWYGVPSLAAALSDEPVPAAERDALAGIAAGVRTGARLAWEGLPAK